MRFLSMRNYFGIERLDASGSVLGIGILDFFIVRLLFVGRGIELKPWKIHRETWLWAWFCWRVWLKITFKSCIKRRKEVNCGTCAIISQELRRFLCWMFKRFLKRRRLRKQCLVWGLLNPRGLMVCTLYFFRLIGARWVNLLWLWFVSAMSIPWPSKILMVHLWYSFPSLMPLLMWTSFSP